MKNTMSKEILATLSIMTTIHKTAKLPLPLPQRITDEGYEGIILKPKPELATIKIKNPKFIK